jgi:hypothetical protein
LVVGHTELTQDASGHALPIPRQTEQEMLGPDVGGPESACLLLRELQSTMCIFVETFGRVCHVSLLPHESY